MDITDSTETALDVVRPAGIVMRPRPSEDVAYTDEDYTIGRGTAEAILKGKSANTRAAYDRWLRNYRQFCAERGRVDIPATSATLTEWVQHLIDTPARMAPGRTHLAGRMRSPGSINQAISAVRYAHGIAGYEKQPPIVTHLRDLLNGYRKDFAQAGGRVKMRPPLAGEPLEAVLAYLAGCDPELATTKRDKALIGAGVFGLLRGGDFDTFSIPDFAEDEPDGITLRLAYSKTDQAAEGALISIPHDDCDGIYCPACSLKDYNALLAGRGLTEGAFFRGVDLHDRIGGEPETSGSVTATLGRYGVDRRVRRLCQLAQVKNWQDYGSHSLRAGGATLLHLAGVPIAAINERGRWKPGSSQSLHYVRWVDWDNHPMRGARAAAAAKRAARAGGA